MGLEFKCLVFEPTLYDIPRGVHEIKSSPALLLHEVQPLQGREVEIKASNDQGQGHGGTESITKDEHGRQANVDGQNNKRRAQCCAHTEDCSLTACVLKFFFIC